MVMLHINLNGITNAATWYQVFPPQTPQGPWGQKVKIKLFQNIVSCISKGIANAATW